MLAGRPEHVAALVNIGVNDFGTSSPGPSVTQWIADMTTVIDAVHAQWPDALVFLMRPWKRGFDARADQFAAAIDIIIAARDFTRLGPDERIWLKGSDNGTTNTTDGIHYSVAGESACVDAWLHSLGY